ncbi:MAG: cysteine rich repeat-containing protein [Geminicoccaceae bacterium]
MNYSKQIVIAACAVLLLPLAACQRQQPPVYAPEATYVPPPAYTPPPPAYAAPPQAPAPTGEQLTIARACAPDIERFCTGVPPRQGMIKQCMKAHVGELSAGCFDTVMSAIAAQQAP